MTVEKDTGYAPERWEFDDEVSRVFDDMLERSIPQYETMREAVTLIGSAFLRRGALVLDLGCSQGETIARLREVERDADYIGLEVSQPMLELAHERFDRTLTEQYSVEIREHDLRRGLPATRRAELMLSVLTLMFVPLNYRQRLLWQCYQQLTEGGALIVVEKTLGEGPLTDDLFNANYHRKKVDSGYDPDDVDRKRLALEGVLVPMPASFTEQMLARAGFREVDRFWSWMNFTGWVAIR